VCKKKRGRGENCEKSNTLCVGSKFMKIPSFFLRAFAYINSNELMMMMMMTMKAYAKICVCSKVKRREREREREREI
jgi:hypothetical protein